MQLRPLTWPSTTVTFTFRVAATNTVTGEHIQTLLRDVHHFLTESWCSFAPIPFPWNICSSKYKPDTARGDWDTDCVYKIWNPCWTTPVNNWCTFQDTSSQLPTVNSPKTPSARVCIPTIVGFLLFDLPSMQFCDPFLEIFLLLASTMARERKTQYSLVHVVRNSTAFNLF